MAPPPKNCPGTKNWFGPKAFGTVIMIYAYFLRKLWHFHDPVKFFDRFVRAGYRIHRAVLANIFMMSLRHPMDLGWTFIGFNVMFRPLFRPLDTPQSMRALSKDFMEGGAYAPHRG